MTVTSSHGSFNKPSICCARSQLWRASSPVTMCLFFLMGCHVVLLPFYTTCPSHHIFVGCRKKKKNSWSPSSQLLIRPHFLGVFSSRLLAQNMGPECLTDIPIQLFSLSPLLVQNMSSPPCSLHPKRMTASARPSAPPSWSLWGAFCLRIHISAPLFPECSLSHLR